MTETGADASAQPLDTNQKYDRQIRIWGEHGQQALERAAVCLINATATGTETLKNLVLPGTGSFTVIDGNDITNADRANNFFLTSPQPTKPRNRALATVEAMHELNDHVLGSYIPHHIHAFINSPSTAYAFFKRFSVVIVSQMGTGHTVLRYIADGCYKANVPLVIVRSYGLLGYMRIQARELCIFDSKEDVAPDLRLHTPFPELRQYVDSFHLDRLTDTTEIAHIPFIIILAKAVTEFQKLHPGNLPSSRKEKDQFLDIVKSLRPEACPDIAENFEEAERRSNMRLCYADATETPSVISHLLMNPRSDPNHESGFVITKGDVGEKISFPEMIRLGKRATRVGLGREAGEPVPGKTNSEGRLEGADRINHDNSSFWIHTAGVRTFFEQHSCLPLRGSLPDMTADTESYVALQKIYSSKAASDAKEVLGFSQKLAERYGVEADVDETSVKSFCRTVHGIRVYSTRSVADEMQKPSNSGFLDAASMEGALDASGSGFATPYYVCLRAVDEFYSQHGRNAGCDASMRESDAGLVHEYVTTVKEELGVSGGSGLWRDYAEEIVRFANVELHNVAAFMGGVASQEITKILTRQFVPVDNTLLVNFAEQTSATFVA